VVFFEQNNPGEKPKGGQRMSIREDVLKARYYLRDQNGNVLEDWEGLCRRVSGAIARDEKEKEDFFSILHDCLFLPNSPALVNAGKEGFSLSACYVLPIEDSVESIFQTVKLAALVQKSGGGTGFSFSRLRPAGDVVGSTRGWPRAQDPLSVSSTRPPMC
jgi:ribonucleoside-diphosphate reductase alpha chain